MKNKLINGLIFFFDRASKKLKGQVGYHDKINIPHFIVVDYTDNAKKNGHVGSDFMIFKHFQNCLKQDLGKDNYTRAEQYSRELHEYYIKKNLPVYSLANPDKVPREFIMPIYHEDSPQIF